MPAPAPAGRADILQPAMWPRAKAWNPWLVWAAWLPIATEWPPCAVRPQAPPTATDPKDCWCRPATFPIATVLSKLVEFGYKAEVIVPTVPCPL